MGIKKIFLIVIGCMGVVLGTIGTAVPLLPTVPFYLLATICFAKSSERLHTWFIGTKLYKDNLESYVRGQGMTRKTKARILLLSTLTMSIGFIMMENVPIGRAVLVGIYIILIFCFCFKIKTCNKNDTENSPE